MSTQSVCIIGVGYVGEHLVEVFSKAYKVIGYDVSPARVELMKKRFNDNANVTIQSDKDGLENCDLFCISVPTLLKTDNSIDTSYVESAANVVWEHAKVGATVVMESSVSVGMTRDLLGRFRSKGIFVGFSPERVDPGRTDPPAEKIPKIISGVDAESLEQVKKYYETVFEMVVPVSSTETAEMCKLSENCFRMINVAYVNEIADNCSKFGIDVYEMINACSTKPYGYMPFYPSLGVGGHCIPVNPFYLFKNNNLSLLEAATKATLERPKVKASELARRKKNVLVVGLAFKPGESYTMNSPGLKFANELVANGANVVVYDPLVKQSDPSVAHLTFLNHEDWNNHYISEQFEAVVVAIKQHDVDFRVLDKCTNVEVIKFCNL